MISKIELKAAGIALMVLEHWAAGDLLSGAAGADLTAKDALAVVEEFGSAIQQNGALKTVMGKLFGGDAWDLTNDCNVAVALDGSTAYDIAGDWPEECEHTPEMLAEARDNAAKKEAA